MGTTDWLRWGRIMVKSAIYTHSLKELMSFKNIVAEQSFVVILHYTKTGIWNGLPVSVPLPVSHALVFDLPHDAFYNAVSHTQFFDNHTNQNTYFSSLLIQIVCLINGSPIQESYSVAFGIKVFFMYLIVLCKFFLNNGWYDYRYIHELKKNLNIFLSSSFYWWGFDQFKLQNS